MGEFIVDFEAGQTGPEYENYLVGVQTVCFDDAQPRSVNFNDILGDFVVGYNWNSPNNPDTLVITAFDDNTEAFNTSTSTTFPIPTTPTQLKDSSTGLIITFPYTISILNISNIVQQNYDFELSCDESPNTYPTTRTRVLTYYIIDDQGGIGPIRTATFVNTPQ